MRLLTTAALLALLCALGPLSGCRRAPCEGVTCTQPLQCQPETGMCVDLCAFISCSAAQICDGATGECKSKAPQPPTPGKLIDRAGRAAINTALTNPFDDYRPTGVPEPEDGDLTKNKYNVDESLANWKSIWGPYIRRTMGFYDGLDGVCGNTLAADSVPPRYSVLTDILADDQLYMDTSIGCSGNYLAVERKALGDTVTDCGGRTLQADAIDVTISQLVAGRASGISDGIATNRSTIGTFPFLGNPVQ